MIEVTGILRNWKMDPNHKIIWGFIFSDKGNANRVNHHARFRDGDYIHTSLIQSISDDGRYITTLNSVYELDPPFVEKDM